MSESTTLQRRRFLGLVLAGTLVPAANRGLRRLRRENEDSGDSAPPGRSASR